MGEDAVTNGTNTTSGSLTNIQELIYSETGLVGYLLAIAVVWLAYQLIAEKKDHKKTINKLYELGVATVKQSTDIANTLEKIYQLIVSGKKGE